MDESESLRANKADWDAYADEYQSTHGQYLGDAGFLWGPEGTREDDLGVLGPVADRDVRSRHAPARSDHCPTPDSRLPRTEC